MCDRAVNMAVLDTYQLKSLDGLWEGNIETFSLMQDGDKIKFEDKDNRKQKEHSQDKGSK
jgi:hypothetical protein